MVFRRRFSGVLLAAVAMAACHAASVGGGTTCQSAPVCPGQTVDACTTTDESGACTQITYAMGDKKWTCAACGDCVAAASAVATACGAGGGDAGVVGDGAVLDTGSGPRGDAADGGETRPVTSCEGPRTCASGETLRHCTTTLGGACVTEAYAFSNGDSQSCTCGSCAQIAALASARCDGPGDAGTDASTCGTPPALHPEATPGVYCPFTAAGKSVCAAGEQCCEPPAASGQLSVCAPGGTACGVTGALVWRCEDALDCAGNAATPVCCGSGAVVLDATCGFHRGSAFTGSHCAASCGAAEVQICESAAQCPAGKTCTPFKTNGLAMGVCL